MKNVLRAFALVALMSSGFAQAQIVLIPAATYFSEESKQGSAQNDSSALYLNATFGYHLGGDTAIGLKYLSRLSQFESDLSDDGAVTRGDNDLSAFGLGIMYDSKDGIYLGAFYLHEPTKEFGESADKVTYEDGSGYVIEAGYKIKAGSMFLGPLLTYAQLEYKQRETSQGVETLDGTWSDTLILPFFAGWFYF
jgi:hypothetical protein